MKSGNGSFCPCTLYHASNKPKSGKSRIAQRAITKVAHHAPNVRVGRLVGKQAGPRQVGGNCAWQDAVAEQEERRRKAIAHFERALVTGPSAAPRPAMSRCGLPPAPRARSATSRAASCVRICERRGELSGGSPAGRKRKLKVQLERGRAPKSHDDKLRLPQRSNGVHECGAPFVGARRRRRSGGAAAVSSRASTHMQREWMVQLMECREPLRRVRRAPSTMCAGSALRRCRRLHRCQRRASEQ